MSDGDDANRVLGEREAWLLRDVFEDAPFEFWARDAEGRCTVQNAAARRWGNQLGLRVEDSIASPDALADWRSNNERAYGGELVQSEVEYQIDGEKRYYECVVVPIRSNGKVEGILGFNLDHTERRRAEDALRVSQDRLKQALKAASASIWEWDLRTGEVTCNPESANMYGFDPPRNFEQWRAMLHPDDRALAIAAARDAIEGRVPEYRAEFRIASTARGERWMLALGNVEREPDGTPVRTTGITIDITERKRAEQELRDVDRRRGEFLGLLSHELRNPLAIIRSSLYVLERLAGGTDHARSAIGAIDRQTSHLARLVDDLLDITRISSGKIRLHHARVDLVELVRRTVDDHRTLLGARTVTMELPGEPVWMRGDATRLAQVLGNVLSNANKFTPATGHIAVKLGTSAGRAVLVIADDGVGIDRDTLDRLFLPFVQADRSVDRSHSGLGLGLALVKMLVDMHGGEVSAHSEGPGRGALFTIRLPLDDRDATLQEPLHDGPGPRRRILIIEDNQDVAEWLADALTFAGHDVAVALDGAGGLATARELGPDVILCDIGLPGAIDGYAVARALQEDPELRRAHRIALSGFAQPEHQQKARDAGFEAHIAKPPDLHALDRLLAALPRR